MAERLKANHYSGKEANAWFWRTHAQQEIDYLEERDGVLSAWEFKWRVSRPPRIPRSFLAAYPGCKTGYVSADTVETFLL